MTQRVMHVLWPMAAKGHNLCCPWIYFPLFFNWMLKWCVSLLYCAGLKSLKMSRMSFCKRSTIWSKGRLCLIAWRKTWMYAGSLLSTHGMHPHDLMCAHTNTRTHNVYCLVKYECMICCDFTSVWSVYVWPLLQLCLERQHTFFQSYHEQETKR